VREGGDICYYVAEGSAADFTFLTRYPFGTEDLKDFHVAGSTGGAGASLDVRVTDLRIRAESVPGLPARSRTTPPPLFPAPGGRVVGGGTPPRTRAHVGSHAGVWLYARQRRLAATRGG